MKKRLGRLLCKLGLHKWDTYEMPRPCFKGLGEKMVMIAFEECSRCSKVSFFLLNQRCTAKRGYGFDAGRNFRKD